MFTVPKYLKICHGCHFQPIFPKDATSTLRATHFPRDKATMILPRESGAEYGTRPNMARSAARKLGARHAEKNSISSARKLSARHAGQKYFCRRRSSVENPRRGPINFPTFFQVWKEMLSKFTTRIDLVVNFL